LWHRNSQKQFDKSIYNRMRLMTTTLIIGLLIPLLGTMLGSAFVGIKGSQ
jgi:hypothetical protein